MWRRWSQATGLSKKRVVAGHVGCGSAESESPVAEFGLSQQEHSIGCVEVDKECVGEMV